MRRLKLFLPVLIWMALIFFGSTDIGSSQHTSRIIGPLLRWLNPNTTEEQIKFVQGIVRKSGHLTEYAILAALIWRFLRLSRGSLREWQWKEYWLAVAVAGLYASSDEFHQLFVSSRGPSVEDVLIDTTGAGLGLLVLWSAGRAKGYWKATGSASGPLPARSSTQPG
jgi:VanZ family protein